MSLQLFAVSPPPRLIRPRSRTSLSSDYRARRYATAETVPHP
jgi:hypothetical protein